MFLKPAMMYNDLIWLVGFYFGDTLGSTLGFLLPLCSEISHGGTQENTYGDGKGTKVDYSKDKTHYLLYNIYGLI